MSSGGRAVEVDAVVVGAGLAGLVAARDLLAAGLDVVVLEAAERVGGRTLSTDVAGARVDLGGTFVGPGQDRVLALADSLGVARHATHTAGANALRWRGRVRRYSGTVPRLDPLTLADVARVQLLLDARSRTVVPGRAWEARSARRLDALTLGGWLRRVGALPGTRDLLSIVAGTTWGCSVDEVSLLHAAHTLAAAGGLGPLLDTAGGAQEQHFALGAQELSLRLAAALGDRVRLGHPVSSIRWDEAQDGGRDAGDPGALVRWDGADGAAGLRARAVVVAVPPALRAGIRFDPVLPGAWGALPPRWPQGAISKAYAVYERPFWRGAGLSGQALADAGPVSITFDASPADGGRGVLLCFVTGDDARRWDALAPGQRRATALDGLVALFGAAARSPLGYVDHAWAGQPWLGGGPVAAPPPGAWTRCGAGLAAPLGPLVWAGTETATRWAGFMDGAVRSGEGAARVVADRLAARGPAADRPATERPATERADR